MIEKQPCNSCGRCPHCGQEMQPQGWVTLPIKIDWTYDTGAKPLTFDTSRAGEATLLQPTMTWCGMTIFK
jgi:hypothetical protein